MTHGKPPAKAIPVITPRLAEGIRRQRARDAIGELHAFTRESRQSNRVNVLAWLRSTGRLAAERRRPPSQGVPAGHDIVYINPANSGELEVSFDRCDKRGLIINTMPRGILLMISKHATEALYQRLHTQDEGAVLTELRPVGAWLLDNRAVIGMESEGFLLSPSGVFPIVAGEPFRIESTDGRYHWVAKTWIADTGLADNTDGKRRIVQAVWAARSQGMQVGLVHPRVSK